MGIVGRAAVTVRKAQGFYDSFEINMLTFDTK